MTFNESIASAKIEANRALVRSPVLMKIMVALITDSPIEILEEMCPPLRNLLLDGK